MPLTASPYPTNISRRRSHKQALTSSDISIYPPPPPHYTLHPPPSSTTTTPHLLSIKSYGRADVITVEEKEAEVEGWMGGAVAIQEVGGVEDEEVGRVDGTVEGGLNAVDVS